MSPWTTSAARDWPVTTRDAEKTTTSTLVAHRRAAPTGRTTTALFDARAAHSALSPARALRPIHFSDGPARLEAAGVETRRQAPTPPPAPRGASPGPTRPRTGG